MVQIRYNTSARPLPILSFPLSFPSDLFHDSLEIKTRRKRQMNGTYTGYIDETTMEGARQALDIEQELMLGDNDPRMNILINMYSEMADSSPVPQHHSAPSAGRKAA
jgi:hypothetical protein